MSNFKLIFFLAILCSCKAQTEIQAKKETKSDSPSSAVLSMSVETTEGIIYFSDNKGLSWENKSEGLPDTIGLGLGAIAVSNNALGIATKQNGIYLFDFEKDHWVNIPSDPQMIKSNPGTLTFYKDRLYVGTQMGGVFSSANQGKSWTNINSGLSNLTIRKLVHIHDTLYAGTNAGIYSYNEPHNKWKLEYGKPSLQVNGITAFDGSIYIGTNQGVFSTPKGKHYWKNVLDNRSIHNISTDDKTIYAMTYNVLLSSVDKGQSWQNIQKGLPTQLYTFNVIKHENSVFAAQWDGMYRKNSTHEIWKPYSKGLPEKFAITNMTSYKDMIVISGNKRQLSPGMTTNK